MLPLETLVREKVDVSDQVEYSARIILLVIGKPTNQSDIRRREWADRHDIARPRSFLGW
jgi:hypothetical protein